jgi:hypothetical protein
MLKSLGCARVWLFNTDVWLCWITARFELDNLNRDYNKINKEVGKLKVVSPDLLP